MANLLMGLGRCWCVGTNVVQEVVADSDGKGKRVVVCRTCGGLVSTLVVGTVGSGKPKKKPVPLVECELCQRLVEKNEAIRAREGFWTCRRCVRKANDGRLEGVPGDTGICEKCAERGLKGWDLVQDNGKALCGRCVREVSDE